MEETKTELQLIKLSEIQSQEVSWLWFPFIPYGKLTIWLWQLMEVARNPKRVQREVRKQVQNTGIGTKSQ